MRIRRALGTTLGVLMLFAGCGGDSTGPGDGGVNVAVQSGDGQFGTPSAQLADPLQVIVTDPVSKAPQSGVTVTWSIVDGSGGTLTTTTSTTTAAGIASTKFTLGSALGTYHIEATTTKIVGSPVSFTAKAINPPVLSSVAPTSANAGDTITLTGQNFSTTADENTVLFSGMRGKVVASTGTQLRVIVPLCVPSRSVQVQPTLGVVAGNALPLTVSGATESALQLARGEVRAFTDPNELACFRLPGNVTGLSLLFVPQNFSETVGASALVELTGLAGGAAAAFASPAALIQPTTDIASEFEMKLRRSEQQMLRGPIASLRPQASLQSAMATCSQNLGDQCTLQVLDKDEKFQNVTATVMAVSVHAIVLQDVNAPANGLTTADFTALAKLFDDPIYDADVATYGAPSDLDSNGKVMILLTPVVNALTPKNSSGFIAGFFYGCDLLSRSSCSGTNSGEIFYAITADPTAQFSDIRTRSTVMSALPPVLAHEFQHMINFYQRGNTTEALWLSEGMAHNAEDVVADAFEARGDAADAATFRFQNTTRANRYLRSVSSVSLLASENDGSLEERGAAYLFVRYLQEQFGNDVLKKLTQSKLSSVANVTAQTGRTWSSLLSDWSIALWADNAPELAGVTMLKQYTYPVLNLRQRFANLDGSYPIKPAFYSFTDFAFAANLPSAAQAYLTVQASGNAPKPLNLTFTGQRGGAFATSASPQMTVLRVQ